jgi:signal transduction histidine kinase
MSTAEYSPRARAERVIASGRTFLVFFALAGVLLTPADQGTFPDEALQLLGFYCVYSVLVWVATRRGALVTRRATALAHAVDLVIAVILTMLTRGSGSPFFLFFAFMLLAATVRWQGWGAWSTGLVVIAAYLGVVAYEIARDSGPIDVNRFVVRVGLLAVMTMILGQLGTYQQRLYHELHQLATSPRSPALTLDEILRESLGYAARVLNAPAAVLIWQDDDDAQLNLAVLTGPVLERRILSPRMSEIVVVPGDVRRFLQIRGTSGSRTLALSERPRELSTPVLGGDLVDRLEIETVIAAALPERSHQGWLLVLNRSPEIISTDDVLLADIVAADISASVEHWSLSQRARDAAVAEARLLVSRDLHDGVLQSLTGCRLNIAAAAVTAERTSAESAAQLRALERSLAHDQQELREVILDLRGLSSPRAPAPLRDLCARVERQWGVSVTLTQHADNVVPTELNAPTLLMVHEALANAVRHGKAKRVGVAISRSDSRLVIRIEDDGHGFAFTGTLLGHELAARETGPRSLRERAETLGGTLAVTSHDTGSTVEIAIPVSRESVCA